MRVPKGSKTNRTALWFAALNIRTQVGKAVLFSVFLLLTALVSFLFIGELLMNADDRMAKVYNPAAFQNQKRNRIVARRRDASPITAKDVKRMQGIKNVTMVDPYDYVNDMNYYYQNGKDYMPFYGYNDEEYVDGEDSQASIQFLDDSHFMHSSACISEDELAAGKMPEELGEIALYSAEGKAMLNRDLTVYIRDRNAWGSDEYLCRDFRVVGILKEKTEQIYFSPEYCQMLVSSRSSGRHTLHFYFHFERGKLIGRDDFIPIMDESLGYAPWTEGEAYELRISEGYKVPEGSTYLPTDKGSAFSGSGPQVPMEPKKRYYLEIFSYDEDGALQKEPRTVSAWGINHKQFHRSSAKFLMMGREAFTSFEDMNNYQASVYFTSYAKTAHVLDALAKAGYEGISTYQTSVTGYDEEKVRDRLTTIVIALVVLLVLFVSEILILRSLLKIQIKDFLVMKFMGMKMGLMRRISYYEMGIYLVFALLITVICMQIGRWKMSLLHEMLYYYEWPGYLLFAGYNLLTCLAAVTAFNHLLRGRMDE